MWMAPGEQPMQLSVPNFQFKGRVQWHFRAHCESRAQWIWKHTVYFHTVFIFWTSVELLERKGDSPCKKATILLKSWEGRYPGHLCLTEILQIVNVIFQNTQGSVSQVYGSRSLQKWFLGSRRAREVPEIKWIHNQAPGSLNLIHSVLPTAPPVFPTESRFGKDAAFASSTATSHTATNPWPCTSLAQILLGSPLRYS